MQAAQDDRHTLAPAEQYLRALWRGRWLFLIIVGAFAGGSLVVTALLPRTYSSDVILSVRPAPQLEPAAMLYNAAVVGLPTLKPDDPGDQGPRRFVRRLQANGLVTAAARKAEVIGAAETVDEGQIRKWISVQDVEKTDLLLVSVSQPTAAAARRFAQVLIARVSEEAKAEATSSSTREFLVAQLHQASSAVDTAEAAVVKRSPARGVEQEIALDRAKLELSLAREQYGAVRKRLGLLDLIVANQQFQLTVVDAPTLPEKPSFPRPVLNLSIGLILGILGAMTVIVLRTVFARG